MTARIHQPDYLEIGCEHWQRARRGHCDPVGLLLADGHYSRRKPGSPQFMAPGNRIVLVSRDRQSVFGWWRPDPKRFQCAMNGLDGWTCVIFRRTGGVLASDLLLDAESGLAALAPDCGSSGMLTYVDPPKIQSPNPGYCYKVAGWLKIGMCSKRRKPLLWKPFGLAGIPACGLRAEAPKPKEPKPRKRSGARG
jgi:hypothetical protein